MQVVDLQAPPTCSPDKPPLLCDNRPKTLKDAVKQACAVRRYSPRTFEAYWHWIKVFVHWSGRRPPRDMGQAEVGAFLSWLASDRQVSASTQRQALAAVLFLYQKVLDIPIGWVDNIVRAKQSQRLPVVLTVDETAALLANTSGTPGLFLRLLYGTGLRIAEGQKLRVKDLDLNERRLTVRAGKGDKDRVVMVPASLLGELRALLEERRRWHQLDLAKGMASVDLPHALARKYPNAGREWPWQYVFATPEHHTNPETGEVRRHHIFDWTIQRHMKQAAQAAGITKPATPHTLRHCFATHLLQAGTDIRTIQELLGHKDVETTMIYTHVIGTHAGRGVVSPLDRMPVENRPVRPPSLGRSPSLQSTAR
jgi:integron integrase